MCKQDTKFSTTVKMFSAQHVFSTLNKNESAVLFILSRLGRRKVIVR